MPNDPGRRGSATAGRFLLSILVLIAALLALSPAGRAGEALKGVALVIGQSTYETLPVLPNPERDARAIENLLARLGFATELATNESSKKLRRTVDGFIEDAKGADVALVYYSGHGIEAGGVDYLIPTDGSPEALQAADETFVSLQDILDRLRGQARITILLLDACRSNPFPADAQLRRNASSPGLPVAVAGLGVPRGAQIIENGSAGETLGEVIGFAAEPGKAATDGVPGTNSPYALALLKHLGADDALDFGQVMTLVTEEVYLATGTRQRPWTNASLRRFLSFGGRPDEASADDVALAGERRKLLLAIAATPQGIRAAVEGLARDQKLPLDPLYGMLRELQVDTSAGPADLENQLRMGADNLKKLLADKVAPVRKDPELIRLAELADRAQNEGAIALARDYRARASARADVLDKTLDQRETDMLADRIELAATYADAADTALLAFDFRLASEQNGKAREQVAGKDEALAFKYHLREIDALALYGDYKGDNEVLKRAITLYEALIASTARDKAPRDWAAAQGAMGSTLIVLGERDIKTDTLANAVAALEAALGEWTRDKAPVDWARAQIGLGNALRLIGERKASSGDFRKSVAAYEAALSVITHESMPQVWATLQSNLGIVLRDIGSFENDPVSLRQAVAAFAASLTVQAREGGPLDLGKTHLALANTLIALGRQEGNAQRMGEAIAAIDKALTIITPDNAPQLWASAQFNLGDALSVVAEHETGTISLHKAASAFEAALNIRKREFFPHLWAITAFNYATALDAIDARENRDEFAGKTLGLYEAILTIWTREREPVNWTSAQIKLAFAAHKLSLRESGTHALAKMVTAFEAGLTGLSREEDPVFWAQTLAMAGVAKFTLGRRTGDRSLILSARQSLVTSWDALKSVGEKQFDPYLEKRMKEIDAALAGK